MKNGDTKLSDLFNGDRIFNIPKYQRAYTWEEDNLSDFLDDLLNQRGDKSYFLGTLLFHQKNNRGEYEIIDVVDGQQRLTTTIIFMKNIIEILDSKQSNVITKKTFSRYIYDGENYNLELENEDNGFLHNVILNDNTVDCIETPSQTRLLEAKKFFFKKLSQLELDRLEKLFEILVNADVILYVVDKISDATQIFELLNDRGKKLTSLESVKSFLMYRIGCLELKGGGEQAINVIQDNFSSIYRIIEKNDVDERDVLRYHTIAFEPSKSDDYNNPSKYIKNEINKLFENIKNDDALIKNEILNYVDRLKNSFSIYKDIKTNKIKSNALDSLVMIGRVNSFYPLMMIVYKKDKSNFDFFIQDLIKFSFKATLASLKSNGESDFYKWIRDNRTFDKEWITLPIEESWWNINERSNEALLSKKFYGKHSQISLNTLKYILFSYENYLREEKGYSKLTKIEYFSTDERTKFSIEHISAQKTESIVFDDEFEENYLNSLGNLVLDSKSSNSRKGNKGVDDKMEEFIKAPIMSQNEINELNINWNDIQDVKKFIEKRNHKIINFIKNNML